MTETFRPDPAQGTAVAIIEPVGGYGGMDYYDLSLCRGLLNAAIEQEDRHSCLSEGRHSCLSPWPRHSWQTGMSAPPDTLLPVLPVW